MAGQLGRLIGVACLLLVACGCAQTQPKPDPKPIDLDEVYGLATKAYEEQNWDASEKHYRTLTQKAPEEAEPWFKLGNTHAPCALNSRYSSIGRPWCGILETLRRGITWP